MAFFTPDNPIALLLAFVLLVLGVKISLSKKEYFIKHPSHVMPLVLFAGLLSIIFWPSLKAITVAAPLIVLIALFLLGISAIWFSLGVPEGTIGPWLKGSGFVKILTVVLIICAISFGVSQIFGEKLLKEPSVSVADAITPAQEKVKIDFAPLFSKQALGMIMLVIILGTLFVFVNMAK